MPPLQYVVANFVPDDFKAEILPELRRLSHKNIIRIIDLLVIWRRSNGDVARQELNEILPKESDLISAPGDEDVEWFTQEDVDIIGARLPDKAAVVLVLVEHVWMSKLDEAVLRANQALEVGPGLETLSEVLERYLIQRESVGGSVRSNGLHHISS